MQRPSCLPLFRLTPVASPVPSCRPAAAARRRRRRRRRRRSRESSGGGLPRLRPGQRRAWCTRRRALERRRISCPHPCRSGARKRKSSGSSLGSYLSPEMQEFLGVERLPRTQVRWAAAAALALSGGGTAAAAPLRPPQRTPANPCQPRRPARPCLQVVKRIWEYVKAKGLQDPKDKRQIVFGAPRCAGAGAAPTPCRPPWVSCSSPSHSSRPAAHPCTLASCPCHCAADDALKVLFPGTRCSMFKLQKHLSKHCKTSGALRGGRRGGPGRLVCMAAAWAPGVHAAQRATAAAPAHACWPPLQTWWAAAMMMRRRRGRRERRQRRSSSSRSGHGQQLRAARDDAAARAAMARRRRRGASPRSAGEGRRCRCQVGGGRCSRRRARYAPRYTRHCDVVRKAARAAMPIPTVPTVPVPPAPPAHPSPGCRTSWRHGWGGPPRRAPMSPGTFGPTSRRRGCRCGGHGGPRCGLCGHTARRTSHPAPQRAPRPHLRRHDPPVWRSLLSHPPTHPWCTIGP